MPMELVTSFSFQNDLWHVPRKDQKKITHALKTLRSDPYRGGGKAKKCFKHKYSNVYRYRLGDYRLIYCLGNNCLKLLMIGGRGEIYQRFEADPDIDVDLPNDPLAAEPAPLSTTHFDPPQIKEPMPGEDAQRGGDTEEAISAERSESAGLLNELLEEWGVPENEREAIANCSSIEDILDLDIKDGVKERVLRWKNPTNIQQVIEEPVFELPSPEDLERYLEGTLKGFLLKLDPEQEKVARKNLKGPTLVKGGPGTGKSLVALYRIRNLMEPDTQKELFSDTPPRTLFVTYTTTLIRASEQLLEPLLGDSMKHIDVTNLDKIVRRVIGQTGADFNPAAENTKTEALQEAIESFQHHDTGNQILERLLGRVSKGYLIAEFDWVIEGREINDFEGYLIEDRTGRGIPFDKETRGVVWGLHERYLKALEKNGHTTWDQLRALAMKAIAGGEVDLPKYDVVIVDEAQDLTPVGVRLCMALCKDSKGFYMTADSGQSIYNRGFSWKRVDDAINVRGRTTILKFNYRSTRQIMEASIQPLRDKGGGDPETTDLIPVLEGPKPILCPCDGFEEQVRRTVQFLKQSSKELRLPITVGAVLVRSNKAGTDFAQALDDKGIPAELVKGTTFDLDKKAIKVMTIHSAKGLEFPFMALVRVDRDQIPMLWNIKDDEKEARLADERRLLSVALSRAMRRLGLFYNRRKPSHFIEELDKSLWTAT